MHNMEPVNIMGVVAYPNPDEENRIIRFIDPHYNTLFTIRDGENIIVTDFDGTRTTLPCRYIDDLHVQVGNRPCHISQYAIELEMEGKIVEPEFPKEGDICDSYEIYQREGTDLFRSYAEVAKQIRFTDYKRVYAGVLASEVNMEFLFTKHNQDNRPFRYKMRAMSIGDILVLKRNGQKRAFYVDSVSFTEIPKFLRDREPKKKARDRER